MTELIRRLVILNSAFCEKKNYNRFEVKTSDVGSIWREVDAHSV